MAHKRSSAVRGLQAGWWHRNGEPLALSILLMALIGLPLLLLLEVLTMRAAGRVALGLAWLAGLVMLPRIARSLADERRRVAALSLVLVGTLAFVLTTGHGTITQAAPTYLPVSQFETLTFASEPRISRQVFSALLQRGVGGGPSPAAPYANELYDIIVESGLDPGVALAFFAHESQFCTTGVCRSMDLRNWGALRKPVRASRAAEIVQVGNGTFTRYHSFQDGLRDWCDLIKYRYIARGLDTVDKAVPVYAPAFDGNVPTAYINAIYRAVASWQGRNPRFAEPAEHVYPDDLPLALLMETFQAAGLDYNSSWAFHKYALEEARAGRALGTPLDESRVITVGNRRYAVQAFSRETLYTPIAPNESDTNWSDVRRLSELLPGEAAEDSEAEPDREALAEPTPAPTIQTRYPAIRGSGGSSSSP